MSVHDKTSHRQAGDHSPEQLRLECLRLAHSEHADKSQVVERARAYHDFAVGRNDADIISAVRTLAALIEA